VERCGISLAKYVEDAKVTLSDISEKVLEVAKKNAKKLLGSKEINFIKSDMFQNIKRKI